MAKVIAGKGTLIFRGDQLIKRLEKPPALLTISQNAKVSYPTVHKYFADNKIEEQSSALGIIGRILGELFTEEQIRDMRLLDVFTLISPDGNVIE